MGMSKQNTSSQLESGTLSSRPLDYFQHDFVAEEHKTLECLKTEASPGVVDVVEPDEKKGNMRSMYEIVEQTAQRLRDAKDPNEARAWAESLQALMTAIGIHDNLQSRRNAAKEVR